MIQDNITVLPPSSRRFAPYNAFVAYAIYNSYTNLDVVLKKFDSRFMSSERNLVISSSIFRISASNRSRMLLNSESITLKSPNLIGMSRLTPLLCAIYVVASVCVVWTRADPAGVRGQRRRTGCCGGSTELLAETAACVGGGGAGVVCVCMQCGRGATG